MITSKLEAASNAGASACKQFCSRDADYLLADNEKQRNKTYVEEVPR